ncbi:MAG: hypothetical protein IKN79_07880, partial [Eubacterium sp.]|nr:hypothetical protein [Eubacterium sp.]
WHVRSRVEGDWVYVPTGAGGPLNSKITKISAEGEGAKVDFYVYGAGEGEDYWTAHFLPDGKGGMYLDSLEPR